MCCLSSGNTLHLQYVRCVLRGYLENFCPGLWRTLAEHMQQHAQQLWILHVRRHHHTCAFNHLPQAHTGSAAMLQANASNSSMHQP